MPFKHLTLNIYLRNKAAMKIIVMVMERVVYQDGFGTKMYSMNNKALSLKKTTVGAKPT